MTEENSIDVEKSYSSSAVAGKLRRLAEALEQEKTFEIQIAGERVRVPASAVIEFEYEKNEDGSEEIEIKWKES